MARSLSPLQEPPVPGRHDTHQPPDLTTLYDQYAPALLGILTGILSDEDQAAEVLVTTFTKVRAAIGQYRAETQPLFPWLLSMARSAALDALRERKSVPTPVIQLSSAGKVVALPIQPTPPSASLAKVTDPKLRELLHAVLFKNCTPEEAAHSLGIPAETARQQLRLAMQQLRAAQSNRL